MENTLRSIENSGRSLVSLIDDWSPPQREKRVCYCGTTISIYNPEDVCHVCLRKREREIDDSTTDETAPRKTKRRTVRRTATAMLGAG